MPAEEPSNIRRNDHMQRMPSNGYQQNGSGLYRPPTNDTFRDRERSRSSGSGASGISRPEPRRYSSPPRTEPQRSYTPAPRPEPRMQPQPQPPRAAPSNNGGGNGAGNRGGSRPWNTPKER